MIKFMILVAIAITLGARMESRFLSGAMFFAAGCAFVMALRHYML